MITMAQKLAGLSATDARRRVASMLAVNGIPSGDLDARLLVCASLKIDHTTFVSDQDRMLSVDDAKMLSALTTRRLNREPIARILGQQEFWSLPLRLSPETLVPRPETETVVEAALAAVQDRRNDHIRIADLGTGSGAILLALLHEMPNAFGVGTDRSMNAIVTARGNAADLGLSDRAVFATCDYSSALSGSFDLIVSNPPYIRSADIEHLQLDVRWHDPHLALDGGADGLMAYRAIAADARRLLAPDGMLVVELGAGQLAAVSDVMANAGLGLAGPARKDIRGIPRALTVAVLS
jgi:release factor glutamine methyltransferase